MTVQDTVHLDSEQFKSWVTINKARLLAAGSQVRCIVLPHDLKVPIAEAFMRGHMKGFVTHAVHKKRLYEYLDGTRVIFAPSLPFGRGWFVLEFIAATTPEVS